jgi:hypothetical protein
LTRGLLTASNILGEAGEGAVEGLLYIIGEDTGGQFVELKVIGNALAALALSGAGLIGAVTPGFIGFDITFHNITSSLEIHPLYHLSLKRAASNLFSHSNLPRAVWVGKRS